MNNIYISPGVLGSAISAHFVAQFVLFFALILLCTVVVGKLCKKFLKIPVIAGQIIAGIILGPSLLNIASWPIFSAPFSLKDPASAAIVQFASVDLFIFVILVISAAFTVPFLLWLAGYETDVDDMLKIGTTAFTGGLLGAIIPVVMTIGAAYFLLGSGFSLISATGLGLIFSATSVSIPVAMLVANNKMGLRSSKATLGAAIIDDILAVMLLSIFIIVIKSGCLGECNLLETGMHNVSLTQLIIRIVISFVAFFGVGVTVIPFVMNYFNKHRYITLIAPFAFVFMLFYFSFSELIGGLAGITGAYFAGLFQRKNDAHHYSENTLMPFINAIFVPLFLASIGLQVDLTILAFADWVLVGALLLVAVVSKFIGIFIATAFSSLTVDKKTPWRMIESYLFGSSMVARGEVGLVISTLLLNVGLVSQHMYVIAVVVITLTTLIAPILLAVGFSYQGSTKQQKEYKRLTLGHFDVLGTQVVFDTMVQILEKHHMVGPVVMLSEGRCAVTFEAEKVEIIYTPQDGIILFGEVEIIKKVVLLVKDNLQLDMQHFVIK